VLSAVLLVAGCGGDDRNGAVAPPTGTPSAGTGRLLVHYDGDDRVVATEHDPGDPDLELTSGGLLVRDGQGWSGPPADGEPMPDDVSAGVFRARTFRDDFGDASVSLRVRNEGLDDSDDVPAEDYDGISLGLRYESPDELYYVNLHRRDGTIAIKRKSPTIDGAEYTTLATGSRPVPYGEWETIEVDIHDEDGAVVIEVAFDGETVLRARDDTDPILEPGRVLLRADNCRFSFNDLEITPT
jgi:hypothetical protein